MHIQYDMTVDDIIDGQLRTIRRSGVQQRWRIESCAYVGVIAALLVLVLVREPMYVGLVLALVAGGAGALTQWYTYESTMRKRLKKFIEEAYKKEVPQRFHAELRPDAIWTQTGYMQIIYDWRDVIDIVEGADAIEILMNGGYLLVRKARLASPSTADEFVALAKRYLQQSKSTTQPPVSAS